MSTRPASVLLRILLSELKLSYRHSAAYFKVTSTIRWIHYLTSTTHSLLLSLLWDVQLYDYLQPFLGQTAGDIRVTICEPRKCVPDSLLLASHLLTHRRQVAPVPSTAAVAAVEGASTVGDLLLRVADMGASSSG